MHLLFFSAYAVVLVIASPLDITLLNMGDKSFGLLYSSKYLERIQLDPIYFSLGWLVTRLPIRDGMSMVIFLSIIPSLLSSILVFASVRKQTSEDLAPWIASAIMMSSWIFFAQAIKVEVYTMVAFFISVSYFMFAYNRYIFSSVFFGLSLCVYGITAIPFVAAFTIRSKNIRKFWYIVIGIPLVIIPVWSYLVPTNLIGVGWVSLPQMLAHGWFGGDISRLPLLSFRLIAILLMSFGCGIIPLYYFIKRDYHSSVPFLVGMLIACVYYLSAIEESGIMQLSVVVPIIAIACGLGVKYIKSRDVKVLTLTCSVVIMLMSGWIWNIDTNPTSARNMIDQLSSVPDGSIIIGARMNYGRTDTFGNSVELITNYHNRTTGRSLVPLPVGLILDPDIKEYTDKGIYNDIIFPDSFASDDINEDIYFGMEKIKRLNPDKRVYYYRYTDTERMLCELTEWN